MPERDNPVLNVVGFEQRPAEAVVEDIASWAVENGEGPLEQRINPRVMFFENGELVDPKDNFKPLGQGLRVETPTDRLENQGYRDVCRWLKATNFGYGLWISPPNGEYPESRFVVYQVELQDNQKIVCLWGLCGFQTGKQCLAIANQLQKDRTFCLPDELRTKVIAFEPPGNTPWTYYLNLFAVAPLEVWQAIESGDAQKAKQKALDQAERAYRERKQQFDRAASWEEKARVVFDIEASMQLRLERRIQAGPCVSLQNIFTTVFNKTETREGGKVYICPVCGARVKPGQKCPVQGCNWRAPR